MSKTRNRKTRKRKQPIISVQKEEQKASRTPLSITGLPDEILLLIFQGLKPEEIIFIATRVCKHWHELTKDSQLKKNLFERYRHHEQQDFKSFEEHYKKIISFQRTFFPKSKPSRFSAFFSTKTNNDENLELFEAIITNASKAQEIVKKRFLSGKKQPNIPEDIWRAVLLFDNGTLLNFIIEEGQYTATTLEKITVPLLTRLKGFFADNQPTNGSRNYSFELRKLPILQFAALNNSLKCMQVLVDQALNTNITILFRGYLAYFPPPLCFAQTVAAAKILINSEHHPAKIQFTVNTSKGLSYSIDTSIYPAYFGNIELLNYLLEKQSGEYSTLPRGYNMYSQVHTAIEGNQLAILQSLPTEEIIKTEISCSDMSLKPSYLATILNRHNIMSYLVNLYQKESSNDIAFYSLLADMCNNAILSNNKATIALSFKLLLQYSPYTCHEHIYSSIPTSNSTKPKSIFGGSLEKTPLQIFLQRFKFLWEDMAEGKETFINNLRQILLTDKGYDLLVTIANVFAKTAITSSKKLPEYVRTLREIDLSQLNGEDVQTSIQQLQSKISEVSKTNTDPKVVACLSKIKDFLAFIDQLESTASAVAKPRKLSR